jgi:hypothetical protein
VVKKMGLMYLERMTVETGVTYFKELQAFQAIALPALSQLWALVA